MRDLRPNLHFGRHRGGTADPYAAFDVAYDFRTASGYLLNTGKVETAYNLASGGESYDATQSTSGDRPTIGTMTDATEAAVFTSLEEWLTADALASLMNTASAFQITIIFESNNIASAQTLINWSVVGSVNDNQTIGTDGTGDIRLSRRNGAGTAVSVDSAVKITADTTQVLTLTFSDDLVTGYLNGDIAFLEVDYIGAAGDIAATTFAIGSKRTTSNSQGWEGEIAFVGIKFL